MKMNVFVVILDNNKMNRNYFIKLILFGWLLNIYYMYERCRSVYQLFSLSDQNCKFLGSIK